MTGTTEQSIPRFIQCRGCINCKTSNQMKERTGNEYGFDHELIAACLISGCLSHGYAIYRPFFDPEELITKARESGNKTWITNAMRYLSQVKREFGKFYEQIGVSLESLVIRVIEAH